MTAMQADRLARQVALVVDLLEAMIVDYRELEAHGYDGGGSGAGAGRRGGTVDPTGNAAVGFQQGAGDEDPAHLSVAGMIRHQLEGAAQIVDRISELAARARARVQVAQRLTTPELATRKVYRWTASEASRADQAARERVLAEGREIYRRHLPRGEGA